MNKVWASRKQRVLAHLKENGIDTALITAPSNIYYLTGFLSNPHERFLALLLDARSEEETLFVPALDAEAAAQAGVTARMVPLSDTDDAYARLQQEASGRIASIGVEKGYMTLDRAERIADAFPGVRTADLTSFIDSLKVRKTEEEIAKVRLAIDTVEKVVEHAASHAVVGMTELELTAELEYQMKRFGADKPSFESIVLTGRRSALPHGVPEAVPIAAGDYLLIDIGVKVQGYCSDITRTFLMGEGTEEQERIYETVLAANQAGISAAKLGHPIAAVDRAAREVIASAGYGEYFTHRVGHGFGMDIHEYPSLHGNNENPLEPGMLFTIEPGIYVPEIGGVRIEDDIYLREDGTAEVLTTYPKWLIRLGE
ncbi:Xaa-Pro peptidase family protein [Cohnella lubricantis]|uniref:Aminopeptidase P family protein n=1 Tax=Cohnella lubricantis TaxID=2163172 RepID=A0A841T7Z6_9BACL|nr:Xaa-Pro peptidase family protein [Cohnella lubricantis]MBB6677444.1 aminopeptidase P family protein [Cohnella lubricantis]MBP2116670.1 Xaa-Pro dipeptidase [Cohnella lubricantis]